MDIRQQKEWSLKFEYIYIIVVLGLIIESNFVKLKGFRSISLLSIPNESIILLILLKEYVVVNTILWFGMFLRIVFI